MIGMGTVNGIIDSRITWGALQSHLLVHVQGKTLSLGVLYVYMQGFVLAQPHADQNKGLVAELNTNDGGWWPRTFLSELGRQLLAFCKNVLWLLQTAVEVPVESDLTIYR